MIPSNGNANSLVWLYYSILWLNHDLTLVALQAAALSLALDLPQRALPVQLAHQQADDIVDCLTSLMYQYFPCRSILLQAETRRTCIYLSSTQFTLRGNQYCRDQPDMRTQRIIYAKKAVARQKTSSPQKAQNFDSGAVHAYVRETIMTRSSFIVRDDDASISSTTQVPCLPLLSQCLVGRAHLPVSVGLVHTK